MGGNTSVTTKGGVEISPDRVPLDVIGRKAFVKRLQDFIITMNREFKKEYKHYIWEDLAEIKSGKIFNGSTSFIMSPDYSDSEIVKYKKSAGDADVSFPREYGPEVYDFLEKHEGREFVKGAMYMGNNANTRDKLGNTLIAVVKMEFPEAIINVQVDLELSDMKGGKQSDWSAFAHSSSFEDAKAGMKGVAGKHFIRGLVGSLHQLDSGFVVVTPASTEEKMTLKGKQPSKIRLLNFSVDKGVTAGYELMKTKIDGKDVYREKKPAEKTYDKNMNNLLQMVFGTTKIKYTDLHSFIKMLKLTAKLDKKVKETALERFMLILYGEEGQAQYIEPNMKEDLALKRGMYMKAVEILKLKPSKDLERIEQNYINKVHKKGINESFRNYIKTLEK